MPAGFPFTDRRLRSQLNTSDIFVNDIYIIDIRVARVHTVWAESGSWTI